MTRSTAAAIIRDPRTVISVPVCVILVALALIAPDRNLYGDADNYWSIAHQFGTEGGFSFDGYVDRLRGYSVPLFFFGIQRLARAVGVDALLLFRVVSAAAGAVLFAVLLPSWFLRLYTVRLSAGSTAAFALLCILYWRGHLLHPLSDFPALLLLTTGVLCLPADLDASWGPVRAGLCGAALALASNARPINVAALVCAVLLIGWYVTRAAADRRAWLSAILFVAGIALVAWPQGRINARLFGSPNPFAHAEVGAGAPNLYLQQLVWGVSIQRYETNVGRIFPVAAIFTDPRGQELLGLDLRSDPRNTAHEAQTAVRRYLALVAGHPAFFAAAYARHLFNGLDVAYPTPYVTRLAPRSIPFALVNFLVLMQAAVYGVWLAARVRQRDVLWQAATAIVFVVPALLTIPTAVECRFMLPLWMLACGFLTFRLLGHRTGDPSPRGLALIVAVSVAAAFLVASATYSHVQGAPASFDVWCVWCTA